MRGDKSWVVGIHETAKMSSILGLPTQGSDVTVLITRVHLHPLCVLVEFWGKFCQERTVDYESLAKDIQSPGNTFQEFEGSPGDQCLVEIDGTWHRSRIVSRNGSKYSVFLIDKGMTSSTTTGKLAWGKKEHFHLPPEVEFCVLANVLPLSPENRWSPVALEFLKSFSGKSVKAHVQDVLVPHRTFVLQIPCISKQMHEMGFAKKLSPDMFQDFVLLSLQSQSVPRVSPELQPISMGAGERLHKQELFMYPELPAGTVETVVVTEVTNPQRIFCQLKVFSQELKKLSEQITQCCEGRMTNCIVGPEMIGFPCAARGNDGRWYRSVLQQVFPVNRVVEVLNVDYGTKQFVKVKNVRPLAAEFFRMPVVTYICSLHGIIDKGVGWTSSQIDLLRNLLLCKTVIAKFEYQSISEGVHYVTLYGDENTNINNLFGSKESCLLECEKTLGNYAIRSPTYSRQRPAQQERNQRKMLTPGETGEEKEGREEGLAEKLLAEELSLNSSHAAVVQHVSNPSEFWIQTQNYANELDELMDSIYHLYKDSENKNVVKNPTVGLYCAAKAEDGDFYRATVSEVHETQVKVFFVDYGNAEVVDRMNIRTLPDKFKKLPMLALKCTLAGVGAKDGRWSQSASEFFIKAVKDKVLNVHVTAKYDDGYVVQLTDPKTQGERDLSTLMCSSNFAERADTWRQPKAKMTIQPGILPPTQHPDARLSGIYRNNGMSIQSQNTVGPASIVRRIPTFKEHMFPIGSVLDVSVSYIESPNDFWCQLVQNTGHLKLLMHDIQAHYAGSEFQPLVETACIARHPDNGMWYRALVILKHETPHVDVLFVDYGQTEMVSLYDLRRICPEFLTLHGQAFRCSLLNPVDPTSAINEWNDEAVAKFHNFVETAVSNFVILKCTIYAVMYSEQKIVFNIVDLETPFESVCTSMVNLVQNAPPKKTSGPSFRLDSYYFSTHNVKTGTEEQITVTCVNNVNQFYCQLERNTDVMKDLKVKVSNLCHQLENVKIPAVFGTLCFAKYTDGHWYRGQIKATKPAILVHFVDYGDTIEVDKSDLLPVPREANDIMSVPVQAVVCGLSDVPANVPSEVNSWFETSAIEFKFRALVVAREPDGKVLVELYHGNTQINSKIKRMFQIEMHTEEQVVYQCRRATEATAKHVQKPQKAVPKKPAEMEDHNQNIQKSSSSAPKSARQMRDETKPANMNMQSALKSTCHISQNGQKLKAAPLQLYRPPHQRESCGKTPRNMGNGSEPAGAHVKPRRENLPTDTQLLMCNSPGAESQEVNNVEKFFKLADLPSKSITSGMEADVYASHCNSPLSFYVQLVRDEGEIFSIAEKLNDPQSALKTSAVKDVHPGDLVQAEFADDSSWYRAVVREIRGNAMALVEFIDFGNTAMTPISKIGRLHESFLQLPMYSTHCMLSDAATLGKEEMFDPEVLSAFKEDIGGDAEKKFKCQFIRQSGSVWEVSLEDSGVNIRCKASKRCSTDGSQIPEKVEVKEKLAHNSEKLPQNSRSLPSYCQQAFSEEQQLQIYITTINDAHSFWCQSADSEELHKIASDVSEVGNAADHKHIDPDSLSTGSPCIVLFSDDQLWYRAEVIDKDGDELSVLFVDYGNKSRVNITDVREMPPDLVVTPPQAFLCELEGFDSSCGSWDSVAVDELCTLTIDKLLQLTVTRVTRDKENIKCFVRVKCDGQVINEVMKTWWKSSTTESKPDTIGLTASYEAPLQFDSTVKEAALPEDQLEYPESQEIDTTVSCIHPQMDRGEEQFTDKLVETHRADDVKLASRQKISETPENSSAESPEDKTYQKSTECNMAIVPQKSASIEGVNICYMLPDVGDTDKDSEEEGASVMDSVGPDGLASPLDENLKEDIDKSEIPVTSSAEKLKTYSFDTMIYSDPTNDKDDSEIAVSRDSSLSGVTVVKMAPREAVRPRKSINLQEATDITWKDLKQIQTELVLPSFVLPVQQLCDAPTEQEIEDGVSEVPCVATHLKNDSMTEEETLAHHEDTYSALPADTDTATIDPQSCTVPSPDLDDEFEEVACLTDVCTDPDELSDDSKVTSATEDCLISIAAEEMFPQEDVGPDIKEDLHKTKVKGSNEVQNESLGAPSEHEMEILDISQQEEVTPHENDTVIEDETSDLHEDKLSALPSDTKAQSSCPDMSDLLEEVTCLVGEICLMDVCRDQQQQAETEDSEQLLHTPPKQKEDFDDTVLSEETLSSADDSFEVQLSKVTHLSLIISNGSADVLPVEQHPVE
uniref:Tudor domain containing 6 n=2 Tax=Seriola dumerili TaxID=41447 RepID=A0A3B4TSE8_SERDU